VRSTGGARHLLNDASGAVVPDPFLVKNCGPYAREQFEILIDLLKPQGARFVTCRQLAQMWQ